jgi:CP family cyanate transporter-like MFS transporter
VTSAVRGPVTGSVAASVAALVIASLALRPQLVGLGPLLPQIQASLGISHGLAGLLGRVTVLCMAAFALPAVRIAHVIGLRAAMSVALLAIVVFGAIRPFLPAYPGVLVATIGIGLGIGLGGALLPRAVRLLLPDRAGFGTGLYSGGIQGGAAIAAATAAPLAVLGDWRLALFVFAVATGVLLLVWVAATRSMPRGDPLEVPPRLPVRSWVAWRLVAVFALNSLCFYGLVTWLPSAYVDLGWTETSAGGLVGLLNLASLPACFAIPWLSDRSVSRHRYVFATSAATGPGIAGVIVAPGAGVLWVALAGLALGALFPLAMTLPIDVARGPADVAGHAALMLTGGYAVAALAPAVLGWLRDTTGSFDLPFIILVGSASVLCALSVRRFSPQG